MGAALCGNQNQIKNVQEVSKAAKVNKLKAAKMADEEDDIADKDAHGFTKSTVARPDEKLWQAVELNDLPAAEKYLDFNEVVESNLYDPFGQTMIHKAASQGSAEMLMLLIERTGAKPDIVNASLATPLHLACRNGRDNVVRFLIGCGVEVNSQDEHGQTPLLISCIHGHKEILSMLVEASNVGHLPEPLEIDLANHQGLTPLNCAAIKGDFDMVKCLVSRGQADINQTSPKGCTPMIYAGRGGYSAVVEYLIEKKASALKQDNAGGTVLHHAIEKGHIGVLETMLANGVDVYSAIEIADNAGRTPLFEAVENLNDASESAIQIIDILTKDRQEGGFGANPNVVNYNGQTPMFAAARQGSDFAIKLLHMAGAKPDLNKGELVKPDDDLPESDGDEDQPLSEKYFMEAFKNCMTPLQAAVVLGYDSIALYLAQECGASVNLQTNSKKYTTLHLCVLAEKPEMIMDLLTKCSADPLIDDSQGRSLLDMVYQYMPAYVESFQGILEKIHGLKQPEQPNEEAAEDDRKITGKKTQAEIQEMYAKQMETIHEEGDPLGQTLNLAKIIETNLLESAESIDQRIEVVYGAKVALCLVSQNWQHKEQALKYISKTTEKYLAKGDVESEQVSKCSLTEVMKAALASVSLTCREKVIKVFNVSLGLFNMIMQSSRIEHDIRAIGHLLTCLREDQLIQKFLMQSESSNTRVTNKIHEAMLDLSYQPQLGEDLVTKAVYEQIMRHNYENTNHKGLMAQLALLYKLVNSFAVQGSTHELDDPKALTKEIILDVVLPSCSHTREEIRTAALKILVDVQKQTGAITQEDLLILPQKILDQVWEKVSTTMINPSAQVVSSPKKAAEVSSSVQAANLAALKQIDSGAGEPEATGAAAQPGKLTMQNLMRYKQLMSEKGSHKDWTQREIALNAMQECFSLDIKDSILTTEEDFLSQCSILLQTSLDENNIQIYLIAVEIASIFIHKVSTSEALLDALPSLLQSVTLRTTDTNTRVRKRSVEVVNQAWDLILHKKANMTSSQIVANVLTDSALNEKAIVGRLGLFIKKALLIETAEDISKKPLQLILGKDYEQIAQFACQWCLHKNTKVRQCALKLAVEICRLNCIDPRGQPFKQRVVNFVLGLRSSIRDPLVKKINEVCKAANSQLKESYIDESELELQQATKARAASYDVRRTVRRGDQQRPGTGEKSGALPQIGGGSLPQVVPEAQKGGSRPTIVLPHSEPLSEQQKEGAQQAIELLSLDLITCFYSQTWSSRYAAIQKLEEQLHNLDPHRRDAMSGEINRNNLPPEISFKVLLKFFEEGLKDPVLKNYITILDLIQTALPIYFRYLRPEQIRKELSSLIVSVVNKMSDLKQKVREASMNFCLYLSHQVEIGCEPMISLVLSELESLQWEKQADRKDMANAFGNSNMIVSCLNLLSQFQLQTSLVTEQSSYYEQYTVNINRALRHSNPQVRKEGESLFKIMYSIVGESYVKELKDQKPQLMTKLIADASAENQKQEAQSREGGQRPGTTSSIAQQKEDNSSTVRDDYLSQPSIMLLLKGNEDKLQQLKLPNPKKRLIAIVEIKKAIQQRLTQMNQSVARDLVEPLSLLLRHLLRDDNVDVFLEALNLLKFIVGNLAQHLSALDLHLMMGQFIAVIVSGQNQNMKARIASDKVIVYFAKHTNIGSLVVAKEVLKNIERLNKSALTKTQVVDEQQEEKKQVLSRFYGILQMLLQQFSIVLCYQPDFYSKCIDSLADTMQKAADEPTLKSTCTQLVISLHQIDAKLLDEGVQKLDFTKKTHLKKICIELEQTSQKGLVNQNQNLVSGVGRPSSPDASFRDTQQSFTSLQSRTSIMSPGLSMNRRLARDRNSEVRTSRGTENKPSIVQDSQTQDGWRRSGTMNLNEQSQTGNNWLDRKNEQTPSLLPSITDSGSNTNRRRQVGQGFVGASSKAAGFNRNDFNNTGEYSNNAKKGLSDFSAASGVGVIVPKKPNEQVDDPSRPPMYVPTQRTAAKKPEGYQPTIMSRMNSNVSQEDNARYRPNLSNQNQTGSSFGPSSMKEQQPPSVGMQKPPPAATFSMSKPTDYNNGAAPQRKNSFY